MLPLINKRWARVLRGPSHAWRVVSVGRMWDEDEDEDDEPTQGAAKLMTATEALAWFTSRPG